MIGYGHQFIDESDIEEVKKVLEGIDSEILLDINMLLL